MPRKDIGSLSKEVPLAKIDETIKAIVPGMPYQDLLSFARKRTHPDAPGLIRKRFLLMDANDNIHYDRFLSLVANEGIESPLMRKVMYFVWAFRDMRFRGFICEKIARSDGKWRISELTKKTNADFFDQWFTGSTSRKVRSNLEYFFVESGIYNPRNMSIHLELGDNWVMEAMQVAAQHEKNPNKRWAMTNGPIEFLIANNLNCLANATLTELRQHEKNFPVEPEPLEDREIKTSPKLPSSGRKWDRPKPTSGDKASTTTTIDLVARERASKSHWLLEKIISDWVKTKAYEPKYNDNIDLYFKSLEGMVLVEIKSCHRMNLHSQIRRGVSQLLEYRYIYRELVSDSPTMVLIIELEPPADKCWLVDYLSSLGIILAWKKVGVELIVTTSLIPESLEGIVFPHS